MPTFVVLIGWLFSVLGSTSSFVINITNSQADLVQHIYNRAQASSVDPTMLLKIIWCESRLNPKAKGDYRSETNEYKANGVAQWWKSSWDKYSKLYNFHGNYNSAEDQVTLMAMVIKDGGINNWYNCSKSLK